MHLAAQGRGGELSLDSLLISEISTFTLLMVSSFAA